MRKALIFLPLLILPAPALAQQTPEVEVFGGYSYLMADLNGSSFHLNGVNLSIAENVNSWFGGALDFSSGFGTYAGSRTNIESLTYGPVFSYRKHPRIVPFSHAMLGAVRGGPQYLSISKPGFCFGVLAGGGVDVQISAHVALRLIQADYFMTRFGGSRQDNIRLSAGMVLRFGKKT
jgi:hypothetical protein